MLCVLSVEGFLAEPGSDIRKLGPSSLGKEIFSALKASGTAIALLSTSEKESVVKDWLTREGFSGYSLLLTAENSVPQGLDFKIDSLKNLLSGGHYIGFYLDSDPDMLRPLSSELGIPVLLSVLPWAKPGRSVDLPYQPWDSLVETIHDERLKRARLSENSERG